MKQELACSVLEIMGIATALVGAILTIQTIIALMGLNGTIHGAPPSVQFHATGMLGEMGMLGRWGCWGRWAPARPWRTQSRSS